MELAIDTSTRYAAVALSREGEPVAELSWRSEQNHTVELMPSVQRLLEGAGMKVQELTAVFVAIGPGGFSALRVGMSAAKGIAEALDVPIVGVGSLEIEAFPYADTGRLVCPILEIGRGEVAWTLFQESEGRWRCLKDPEITSPEEMGGGIPAGTVLCGEGLWAVKSRFPVEVTEVADLLAMPPPTRRATTLARLGAARLAAGQHDDRASLQPFYLRQPSITVRKAEVARDKERGSGS
jgi:tRNA threonylcarbamoyl adenosine modification protein YeaZ